MIVNFIYLFYKFPNIPKPETHMDTYDPNVIPQAMFLCDCSFEFQVKYSAAAYTTIEPQKIIFDNNDDDGGGGGGNGFSGHR